TLWPANPDWQRYVEAPASRDVHPVSVVSTSGQVTGADALTHPGQGGSATLTRTAADTGSTDIVLDYGQDVGGLPEFTVTSATGSPTLLAGYSEAKQFLTANGDGGTPWGSGDPSRSDSYTVSGPGTIVNRFVQGGERYQEISLTSPGSVTLSSVEIYYEAYLGTPGTYQGYFVSSSDQLNRIWYDGAYTENLVQMPPGTPGGYWQIVNGELSADGGGVGQLTTGASWTDYTDSFKATIVTNQAGWVVRSQNPSSNDLLILNADNDTAGTPNVLQELVQTNGNYYTAGDVTVPFDVKPGTTYDVSTTVSGATVTTSINGQQVASFSTSGLPSGVSANASGTVGFREFSGENADFSDLVVTGPTGATLYANPLGSSSDLSAFAVPGSNTLPLILDGAKRDRAVWEGDLSVSGPTLLYSSDATAYLKDSLLLLGSYQLQSGFVEGALAPSTPVNTGGLLPGTVGTYSATYSMYFVTNLADYYRYTGDRAFVRQEWPVVQRELAWNATQLNAQGLFVTDSSDGSTWNLENLTGAETDVNALYYQALTDGATLASAAGQSPAAAGYRTDAKALRTAINANLWDPALGAYDASTSSRGFVSQDANVLPVLYGVATARDVPSVLATVRSALSTPYGAERVSTPVPSGYNEDISPFMGSSQLWADFSGDDTADAMTLLSDEWGYMAANDPDSTDWERFQPDGTVDGGGTSWAHGWSTGSTTALSQDVLGISPVTAGYQTWLVRPQPGTLSWAEGQAPTPHGPLTVDWGHRSSDGEFAMHVSAPAGTSGEIAVPTFGRPVTIQVNGHPTWDGQRATASGVRADGNYIVLSGLPGGSYDIVTHTAGPASRTLAVTPQQGPVPAVGGMSSPVAVTVTGQAAAPLSGQVGVSVPAGWTASPAPFSVNGTDGPASEVVTVHVTPPSGVSGGPVPLTVTASAGGVTAHAQVSVLPYGHWPSGTTATASSYHAPNTVNGQMRTYVPGNAIDGDLSTFWNDANPATYPAVLTVTSPSAVALQGIAFGSSADGVPVDFTISTWNGSAWVQQAAVTGNSQVYRWIPFTAPVSTTQVQITVTKDQPAYAGEFTRISELDP
ncbi:MAG: alpha-L-rhamnosidase C-terminal domain-containing protein, partial [Streptosporangiaceae bacterium]